MDRESVESIIGDRFYDTQIDESFTVVECTWSGDIPILVLIQYDDGIAWDEAGAPELLEAEDKERLGVMHDGLESGRYVYRGPGPTIEYMCNEKNHDWFPLPSDLGWADPEVWYSSVNEREGVHSRPVDLYLNIARCRKCGLSPDTVLTFSDQTIPSVCMACGIDLVPGETEQVFLGDYEYCDACAERLRQEEAECAVCEEVDRCYDEYGEGKFRYVNEGIHTQFHDAFDIEFGADDTPICLDCWRDRTGA